MALAIDDHEPALELRDDPPVRERPRHTTRLLPLIAQLLAQADMSFAELDRIAVGIGPGTFTGLRIGIATARALALARSIPLVGVSTLHALALGAQETASPRLDTETVTPVLDARRGEVFAAAWSVRALQAAPLLAPRAMRPDALAELLRGQSTGSATTLAIGDGALAFRSALERSGALVPGEDSKLHLVSAAQHCRLAESLPPRHPDDIHPSYLRAPDAQPARQPLASAP